MLGDALLVFNNSQEYIPINNTKLFEKHWYTVNIILEMSTDSMKDLRHVSHMFINYVLRYTKHVNDMEKSIISKVSLRCTCFTSTCTWM